MRDARSVLGGSRSAAARIALDLGRRVPDAELLARREPLARAGDAERRVGATDRVVRQVDVQLDVVERAQETAELRAEARARLVRECRPPRARRPVRSGAPKNGHGKRSLGSPTNVGTGMGKGRSGASRGSTASSRSTVGIAISAPRNPKRPALLDGPDRVVPALAEEPSRRRVELRELVAE